MAAKRKIHLIVSIDTECDKGVGWKIRYPFQFDSVLRGIPDVLSPLFDRNHVKPTYLLSPEVIRDPACAALLRQTRNCELGTHLHGEYIEPESDFRAEVTAMPQSAYSAEVEQAKLEKLTELFEAEFGRRPVSFRAGRFSLSRKSLGFLDRLGYQVDSSVTPFRTNRYADGITCNYWGAPLHPYHPSERDPRRAGALRLLEVPVTILVPALSRWPAFILRQLDDRILSRKRLLRCLGVKATKIWVRPYRGTAAELTAWADTVIRRWTSTTPPIINVMFHNVEVIPGASPYAQNAGDVAGFVTSMDALFQHLNENYEVESMGLGELGKTWTN